MATLVLRLVKGTPLTNTEVDNNFSNLNTDVASRVLKGGDTMTGALVLSGDPTLALHATTKQYTDSALNARLQLAGGTMSGKLVLLTSSGPGAGLLIPIGSVDPTSPVNGDVWNTSGVLKHQVAGATKTIAFTDSAMTGNAATASRWITPRTVSLTGDVTGAVAVDGSGDVSIAATGVQAARWTTARAISITGDGTWTVSVTGAAAVSAALTLASVNSNIGAFGDSVTIPSITVNAKGLITAVGTNVVRSASTVVSGIVQLSDSISTTSSTLAATSTAVKAAYDLAAAANGGVGGAVLKSGDTMTGLLVLSAAPTINLHAATKLYVDDRVKIYSSGGSRVL